MSTVGIVLGSIFVGMVAIIGALWWIAYRTPVADEDDAEDRVADEHSDSDMRLSTFHAAGSGYGALDEIQERKLMTR